MSPLDSLREKVFHGYKRRDVTVNWWTGRQTANLDKVLNTSAAERMLRDEGTNENSSKARSKDTK